MEEPAGAATATATAASQLSGFPDWVLLDTVAHIGHCNNATTARSTTSAQSPITVSFEVADPPRLSRCVLHCPDLELEGNLSSAPPPPLVIGADGAFLLIRVCYPQRDDDGKGNKHMFVLPDVFVYRADPRTPSLRRLPRPYPMLLDYKRAIGVLADDISNNQHCSVVIPERTHGGRSYTLEVFCTRTMSWSTKNTRLAPGVQWYGSGLNRHEPTKVFSIGGGSLAWVDLRYGILLCDVLDEQPEIQLIQLPQLMRSNEAGYRVRLDGARPPLFPIRDVSFRDGFFKLIEMEYPYETDGSSSNTAQLNCRWKATFFKTTAISSGQWDRCHAVASSDLACADSSFLDLFPEIWDNEEDNRMVLSKKVMNRGPTLDMYHDDDTVYMISKLLGAREPNGWLFALDTKARKLKKVVPFSAQSVHSHRTVMQCAFSNYLNKFPCLGS